jgi:hypothetical protein
MIGAALLAFGIVGLREVAGWTVFSTLGSGFSGSPAAVANFFANCQSASLCL